MTTAALCAQDLMVERKIWRHVKAWEREMADFEAKPKGNTPWIWEHPVDLGLRRAWQAGDDICRRAISGGA